MAHEDEIPDELPGDDPLGDDPLGDESSDEASKPPATPPPLSPEAPLPAPKKTPRQRKVYTPKSRDEVLPLINKRITTNLHKYTGSIRALPRSVRNRIAQSVFSYTYGLYHKLCISRRAKVAITPAEVLELLPITQQTTKFNMTHKGTRTRRSRGIRPIGG